MRRSLGLLALLGLACGPGKPDVEVDGWALAREALADGESCYADRPEYCLSDTDFVDPMIQSLLDARYEGTMPPRSREVDKLIRSLRVAYERAQREPENLQKIAALVEAHYADPPVDSSDPERVNVDLGALPGELTVRGRTPEIVLRESALIEDFWWQSAEAGKVLAKYATAHPDKPVVRVELLIPRGRSSRETFVYRYFREREIVAFGELGEDSVYLSEPTSLEAMAAGQLRLDKDHRKLCSKPKSVDEPHDWCPWKDPFHEAHERAAREARRNSR